MSDIKEKLNDLKETIAIGDDSLSHVRDMLGSAAHASNGAPDKLQAISEAQGHMAFVLAKLAIKESTCPYRNVKPGKFAAFYPYRWQLTAIACVAMVVLGGDKVFEILKANRPTLTLAAPSGN